MNPLIINYSLEYNNEIVNNNDIHILSKISI